MRWSVGQSRVCLQHVAEVKCGHVTVSVNGSPPERGKAVSKEAVRAITALPLPLTNHLASKAITL